MEGKLEGREELAIDLIKAGILTLSEGAKRLGIDEKELETKILALK